MAAGSSTIGGGSKKTRLIAGVLAGLAVIGGLAFAFGDDVVARLGGDDGDETEAAATDDGGAATATETEEKETVSLPCFASGSELRCSGPRPDEITGVIVRTKDWVEGGRAYLTLVAGDKPAYRSTQPQTIPDSTATEETNLGSVEFEKL